jgi:hypothetical protein
LKELKFRNYKLEYLQVYFLIAITGCNFFSAGDEFLIYGTIISFLPFRAKGQKYGYYIFNYLLFFAFLQIAQFIIMGGFEFRTLIKILFRIMLAYNILKCVGRNFVKIYVDILYFFTLISFIFYFTSLLFPSFSNFFINNVAPITQPLFFRNAGFSDVIIYNFGAQQWNRNSGPFWEPGAFVGFLSIAIIFDYLIDRNVFCKKKVTFYIAMLTTLSTTGYVVLFIILFFFLIFATRKWYYHLLFLAIAPIAYYLYNSVPFLNKEITDSYFTAIDYEINDKIAVNRFSSIKLDWEDFKKSPIVGTSDNKILRYGDLYEEKEHVTWTHRNNGVSLFLATFGILGFLVYFTYMFKSFKKVSVLFNAPRSYPFFMLLVIFTIGMSEKYFNRELFFGLTILFMTINIKTIKVFKTNELLVHRATYS